MREARRMYLLSALFFVLLFLFFDKWYFVLLLIIQFLMLMLFSLLLRWDTGNLLIEMKLKKTCRMGMGEPMTLLLHRRHRLLCSAVMEVELQGTNKMFGTKLERIIRIPVTKKQKELVMPLGVEECGEFVFHTITIRLYDAFGLCKRTVKTFTDCRLMVYPMNVLIQMDFSKTEQGFLEGEKEALSRRGKDETEVYDLREYAPGDALRSIHWKLSSKLDEFIVKEPGDTLHTDILVLLDMGKEVSKGEGREELLASTVSLAQNCCRSMIENGMNYVAAFPSQKQLNWKSVMEFADYVNLFDTWMGIEVPDKNGTGLKYWMTHQRNHPFTYMIYLTNEKIPEELFSVSENLMITVICVVRDGERAMMSKRKNIHLIELPYRMLQEENSYILM